LHSFLAHDGPRSIWTTFSADQVDLNVRNPKVLLNIIDILLEYVQHGAQYIRLDAIAFLWKEPGTDCLHHPHTHHIVQLFRAIFEELCPHVKLITETNVPHRENMSYFGDGHNEAHMIYNFTLPPLLAWSIIKEQCDDLRHWAQSLLCPSKQVSFFNFTASHDGIGLRPLQGILSPSDIELLAQQSIQNGGQVSYKDNGDGTKSPYELNCNYMDFLKHPTDNSRQHVAKFVCSQALMLAMPGVPGIYVHSILGSGNDYEELESTGRARSINRGKFNVVELERELATPQHRRHIVFNTLKKMIRCRREQKAFHPQALASYPDYGSSIFAIARGEGREKVLCCFNLSSTPKHAFVASQGLDLFTGQNHRGGLLRLAPWGMAWLKLE
jgi:glucosylglycerate phosphorylase